MVPVGVSTVNKGWAAEGAAEGVMLLPPVAGGCKHMHAPGTLVIAMHTLELRSLIYT